MAWGKSPNNLTAYITRLTQNDPTLTSLYILPQRRVPPAEFTTLFAALGQNTSLIELHLSGHQLPPEALKSLSQALRTNTALQRLNIGDRSLGSTSNWHELCEAIAASATISDWGCANKGIGPESLPALSLVLTGGRLRSLDLSGNSLSSESLSILFKSQTTTSLKVLDLSHNNLRNIDPLIHVLDHFDLEELILAENPLSSADASSLGRSASTSLTKIDISGCLQGNAFLLGMNDVLHTQKSSLKTINLSETGIDDSGLTTLAKIAPFLTASSIVLQSNNLTDEGVQEFARVVTGEAISLDFSTNSLSDISLMSLLQLSCIKRLRFFGNKLAMKPNNNSFQNSSVESLDISCCSITPEAFSEFLGCLTEPNCPSLLLLEIGGNTDMKDNKTKWQSTIEKLYTERPTIKVIY